MLLLLLLLRSVVIGMLTVLLLRVVVVVGDASCSVSENFLPIVVVVLSVGGMWYALYAARTWDLLWSTLVSVVQ